MHYFCIDLLYNKMNMYVVNMFFDLAEIIVEPTISYELVNT